MTGFTVSGSVRQREVRSLDEALEVARVVVNCTGLGSRELLGDESLFPIRGEVLRVAPPPTERFLLDEQDEARGMTYLIPRFDDCILGGTAEARGLAVGAVMGAAAAVAVAGSGVRRPAGEPAEVS